MTQVKTAGDKRCIEQKLFYQFRHLYLFPMVKRLLIRLVYEYGGKALNSVFKAYKETVKEAPKTGGTNKQSGGDENKKPSGFSFSNLVSSPMTREEALKILNLKEDEASPEKIMEKFDKYLEANDPLKGGSFYIQNKVYYAKELLMEKFPNYKKKTEEPNKEETKEGKETNTEEDNINNKI